MSEPNLFIAETAKGGTSSLRMWLDQHPQVSLSEPKELHFFCGCPNPELRAAADLDEYLEFVPQNEVRGEASRCNLYGSAYNRPHGAGTEASRADLAHWPARARE